jgi:hypothetical protein
MRTVMIGSGYVGLVSGACSPISATTCAASTRTWRVIHFPS